MLLLLAAICALFFCALVYDIVRIFFVNNYVFVRCFFLFLFCAPIFFSRSVDRVFQLVSRLEDLFPLNNESNIAEFTANVDLVGDARCRAPNTFCPPFLKQKKTFLRALPSLRSVRAPCVAKLSSVPV